MHASWRRWGRPLRAAAATVWRRPWRAVGLALGLATLATLGVWLDGLLNRPAPVPDDAWGRLAADDRCLAQAIYFEARGEPLEGRMAVAQVVLNRVGDRRYPDAICAVVFQNEQRRHRCQFSFACDGKSDRPREGREWTSALRLARLLNAGHIRDLTGHATHYHATRVKPAWAAELTGTVTIGHHRFYREEGSLNP